VVFGWRLAFLFMMLLALLYMFLGAIHILALRKHAGWIGFVLLAISFLLQMVSTTIEAFNIKSIQP
jgi:hypothetical protein